MAFPLTTPSGQTLNVSLREQQYNQDIVQSKTFVWAVVNISTSSNHECDFRVLVLFFSFDSFSQVHSTQVKWPKSKWHLTYSPEKTPNK